MEGNLLNSDGKPTVLTCADNGTEVVIGLTRQGNPQVVGGVQAQGTLLSLVFSVAAVGQFTLSYAANQIQDINNPPIDISNHPWFAGTVTIQ